MNYWPVLLLTLLAALGISIEMNPAARNQTNIILFILYNYNRLKYIHHLHKLLLACFLCKNPKAHNPLIALLQYVINILGYELCQMTKQGFF